MNKLKIGLITLGLAFACTASAALVSYISNEVVGDVKVSSPVTMSIYEGAKDDNKIGEDSLDLGITHGGSSMIFTTTATNNANNRIGGYYVMTIEATDADDVVTGNEFSSIDYTINESYIGEDGELISIGKLCVVRGDGSLTKLADIPTWSNKKMILFYDYDSIDSVVDGSVEPCSEFTPILAGETRSFTHLDAGATRVRTFTPTWNTGVIGNFKISSQYVIDLATYANDVYFN